MSDTYSKAGTGFTVWLTGLSGAGKTTIALQLQKKLSSHSCSSEILDGDIVRTHLSKGLTFSSEDRCENIMRIGFVSELLSKHGVGVIVSAISPFRSARDAVRKRIPNFIEVFVNCPLIECERRDVKGLYKKARAGEIKNFTGIDDPYEPPLDPEVICNTDGETIDQSIEKIYNELTRRELVNRAAFASELYLRTSHL